MCSAKDVTPVSRGVTRVPWTDHPAVRSEGLRGTAVSRVYVWVVCLYAFGDLDRRSGRADALVASLCARINLQYHRISSTAPALPPQARRGSVSLRSRRSTRSAAFEYVYGYHSKSYPDIYEYPMGLALARGGVGG